MKKKFIVALGVSAMLLANPLSFSYAKNELVEGRALSMAHQYIENSLSDEAWAGNNPVISAQNKFYTDDAKKVSYIEYKVTCDSSPDCGFIMMNVDGNDVSVPIASPTGNTPSEILDQGNDVSEKLYYFGPFDLYSENEVTGDVQALDPQVAVDLRDDTQVKRSSEEARLLKEQREALKNRLKDAKLAAKEFKKSDEFKKQKEEIKDQILNVPKEEFSINILDMANAANYTSPGASDVFVAGGAFSAGCLGKTPCYNQFQQNYSGTNGTNCYSGCGPTSLAIIYGYHDRNGFPNLFPSVLAPVTNNTTTNSIINTLRGQMLTTCTSTKDGRTNTENIPLAEKYAKDNGYPNSDIVWSGVNKTISQVFTKVKSEIVSNRPILLASSLSNGSDGHIFVAFGYKFSSNTNTNIVRVNMGWGGTDNYISNGTTYYTSNIDFNLSSILYNNANHIVSEYLTVLIKQ